MIHTVTGPVEPSNYENILIHEHIGCVSNDLMHVMGEKWLNKKMLADFAVDIFRGIKMRYGVGMIIDATPIDLGRDILLIKEVSERSEIPMVASAGLYHYPSLYTAGHSEMEIASWFIKEYEDGIQSTGIKPGILKVASDFSGITTDNKKRLTSMAITQKETNLPIYVHSVHDSELVDEQLKILLKYIKTPEKIIIGHTALKPDDDYLEKILDKGCYICMDQCHCTKYSIDSIANVLVILCKKGYADKILLSNDLCIYTDFGTRNNTGFHLSVEQQIERFGHIFTVVYNSFLENGGNAKDWETMFKKNPIKILDI